MKKLVMLVISFIIISFIVVYLIFFYYPKCNDPACWDSKLKVCSKVRYINSPVDVTWEYKILGKETIDGEEKCKVKVLAIDIKRGLEKTEILEGKEMICFLPYGVIVKPEANPNLCTGKLKEEMQNLIIQKLHEYILQNLGEIKNELIEIEGITSQTQANKNSST